MENTDIVECIISFLDGFDLLNVSCIAHDFKEKSEVRLKSLYKWYVSTLLESTMPICKISEISIKHIKKYVASTRDTRIHEAAYVCGKCRRPVRQIAECIFCKQNAKLRTAFYGPSIALVCLMSFKIYVHHRLKN